MAVALRVCTVGDMILKPDKVRQARQGRQARVARGRRGGRRAGSPGGRVLRAVMAARVVLGSYSHVTRHRALRWALRLYCAATAVLVTCKHADHTAHLFAAIEFDLNIALSLLTADEHFRVYWRAVVTCDALLGSERPPLFSANLYWGLAFVVLSRLALGLMHRSQVQDATLLFVTSNYMRVSMDMNYLMVILVFEVLRGRMRRLRRFLEGQPMPVNVVSGSETAALVRHVRKCVYNYNNLLDNLQHINKEVQYLLFLALVFNFGKLIWLAYITAKFLNSGRSAGSVAPPLVEIALTVMLVSAPGVMAELVAREAAGVRAHLQRQQRTCLEPSLRWEAAVGARVVARRPFTYSIWRAAPLDVRLPLSLLTLCLTYVIVLLQITHL